jgi:hypothetical protein
VTDPAQTPAAPPPAPPKQPRGCLPTLLVLLIMLGVVGGGYAAADAVASVPPQPVTVAEGVTIRPLPGWEFGGRGEDGRSVLLSKGNGSVHVSLTRARIDATAALTELLRGWRAQPRSQVSSGEIQPADVRISGGAVRVSYSGTFEDVEYPVEGEATAVAGTTATVIFDGWSGMGDYAAVRPQIDQMIREATIP